MQIFLKLFVYTLFVISLLIVPNQITHGKQGLPGTQDEPALRDTTYLRHLNELSKTLLESNQFDSARIYIDEALHLTEVLNDIEGEAYAINNLGFYYMDQGLPDSVVRLLDGKMMKYRGTGREIQLGNLLANAHNMLGNFKSGLEIYLQMKELAEERGEKRMAIGITQNIGNNYKSLGDIPAAIDAYLNSLEMAEEINDTLIIAVVLDNLASVNVNEGNYDIAEEYLYRALEMNLQIGNQRNQITNYMSFGGLYRSMGRYEDAQESYGMVLQLSEELGHTLSKIQALYNLGMLNLEIQNYDRALEFFEDSQQLSRDHNVMIGSYYNQFGMAGVYAEIGDYARSIELYESALEIAEMADAKDMIRGTLKSLHENYAALGDTANAYLLLKRYTELTDSLSHTERIEALARQEIQLGLRSERERSELLQENLRAQRINTIISLILLGVIVLALLTTILLYQKKKKANILLKKQSEELSNVNDVKDRLLSVLAHDLRAPISNIQGVIYMIRKKLLDKEDIENVLGQIDFQLEQDINTLTNYLQWAQTQRDGIKVKMEMKSIPELMHKAVSKIKQAAENKEIYLKIITDKDLQAPVDEHMFSVIMRNLLSNAVKYVDRGSQVIIHISQGDTKIYVTVEDSGKGIPYKLQPSLFKPFSKVHADVNDSEIGTGLGLSICKDFALKMGGDLTFESKPGIGSKFTLILNKQPEPEKVENHIKV
ncbi:MAG: hypothetical protein EA359_09945 [Balneolaceae bacterium]|nr:MAG: hypothetical protein EA359_09945 [Balneolaceae bacterium]